MEINGVEVEENIRYDSLGLSPELMQALNDKGYTMATPVQGGSDSQPDGVEGRQWPRPPPAPARPLPSASPCVEHIDPALHRRTQALVLAPTRELAIQIVDELRVLCSLQGGRPGRLPLRRGQPIEKQISQLKKKPQIVVATPGRLMDHMQAPHRPAGQGGDRRAGRGRPDAGHGLCSRM